MIHVLKTHTNICNFLMLTFNFFQSKLYVYFNNSAFFSKLGETFKFFFFQIVKFIFLRLWINFKLIKE